MNRKPYSQILDAVAGDQIPTHLDLAPTIMARVQKGKGIRMQPRLKLVSAVLMAVIAFSVLFFTVPGVAAAIGRWFGYVPGVGLVREGQVRVLAEPVSVTRDGVTVTVDQVLLNPERTTLLYTADGIPADAQTIPGGDPRCDYMVVLRQPDGSPLLASPNGVQGWGAGYQHRFDFPPLPAEVDEATLMISCLFNTRSGSAPENWEIPLSFVPAPADMTAFPVIEIPTATAPTEPPDANAPDASAPVDAAAATAPAAATISLTLDRAVQMDDGYLIYATLHWEDSPFAVVDVMDPVQVMRLLDANGQEMLFEVVYDENTGLKWDARQTVIAIKTAPVQTPGPLTVVLESMLVDQNVEAATFLFDPGPDPQPGQTWTLDQEVTIGEQHLRVHSATTDGKGYSFEMSSDTGIVNASVTDLDHPIANGGGGGGSIVNPGQKFFSVFNYADGLPEGPVTVTVGTISVVHDQRLEAQWTPPAASPNLLPTQSAACLTAATWSAAQNQPAALPEGLSGMVLTSGYGGDPGSEAWSLTLATLDGANRRVFPGAEGGAISPDGSKLAQYTYGAGISITDLVSGATVPLPGVETSDFNPVWSPDGTQLVFNRGNGVFDLFIINLDGSNLRRLTEGGVQEWPAGWLENGHLLYSVPGRVAEYTIYEVDVATGESKESSRTNIQSVSPDGKYILTYEKTFGDRWLVYVSAPDGSNRWLLNDSALWVLSPVWSPDGEWLLAGVSATDSGSTTGALVNLRTCQVIALPEIKGSILSWVK